MLNGVFTFSYLDLLNAASAICLEIIYAVILVLY